MQKLFVTGLLTAFLTQVGCGSEGGSNHAVSQCAGEATATDILLDSAHVVHPEAFDAKYSRFLVQTKGDQDAVIRQLKPSGANLNEYRVVKFTIETEALDDRWQIVSLKDGDRAALLETLMKTPGVVSVEPDFEIRAEAMIEEAAATSQWAHLKVDSNGAWRYTRGSERVLVAVLDGGIDISHPDLAQNVFRNSKETVNGRDDDGNGYIDDVNGWDYVNGDSNPRSDSASHFHGSHVAGIVGAVANRSSRLIGHAPLVRILPLKFIGSNGSGNSSHAIRAIDYAIKMGAHIINASWSSTSYSNAMYSAIQRAKNAGILFVAAAGNDGESNESKPHYPASYGLSNIISVAASNSQDKLPSFSNYGENSVDIAAPGSSIFSLKNNGAYATMSGTSMATPLVTGIAALVKAYHFSFTYTRISQSLFMGVDSLSSMKGKVKYGGRINARKALQASDDVYRGKGIAIVSADPEVCGG